MRCDLLVVLFVYPSLVGAQTFEPLTITEPTPQMESRFGGRTVGVPDLTGDGYDDIIVSADFGRIYVLSGTTRERVYYLVHSEPSDGFGASISGLADLDADGASDYVIGAPYHDTVGLDASGMAYVYSGAEGVLLYTLASPTPTRDGFFGLSTAAVPDTDGDGINDILIGAHGEKISLDRRTPPGRAYLFSGLTGHLLHVFYQPPPQVPYKFGGANFGWSVAGVPDADGDLRGDVLIGAQYADTLGVLSAGSAYLFSGQTGDLLHTVISPSPTEYGSFGVSVLGLEDKNGDGKGDLLIGAIHEPGGVLEIPGGRAYVIDGSTTELILQLETPAPYDNGIFGHRLAEVPDTNGDGVADLLISAWHEPGGDVWAGRAYLFDGANGNLLSSLETPNPARYGLFGISVSGIRDLDGDGLGDFLIGAPGEWVGELEDAGHVYLYLSTQVVSNEIPLEPAAPVNLVVYPNPFHNRARCAIEVTESQHVLVEVFNELGQLVQVIHDGNVRGPGVRSFTIDAGSLASGVFLLRVTGETFSTSQTITSIK